LNPSTTYNFYVIAKDAAGNASPQVIPLQEQLLQEDSRAEAAEQRFLKYSCGLFSLRHPNMD
jgi:hypothetical protein